MRNTILYCLNSHNTSGWIALDECSFWWNRKQQNTSGNIHEIKEQSARLHVANGNWLIPLSLLEKVHQNANNVFIQDPVLMIDKD